MTRKSITRLGGATGLAGLIALLALLPAASAPGAVIPNCVPAKNIEAIIDDSSSMLDEDPLRLRVSLLEILAGNPLNKGKQMGVVEFGSSAGPISPISPIGTPAAQSALSAAMGVVQGNGFAGGGSGTDYNDGFNAGNAQNPTADARIFLSDGAPNAGTYDPNVPKTPPTKTYVIGFAGAATSAGAILQEIAANTGGQAFLSPTSTGLLVIAGQVKAALNCKTPPKTFVDNFTRVGQQKSHSFKATGKVADILVSWPNPSATFSPNVRSSDGSVATVSKVKKVVQRGTTFQSIHLTGLKKKKKYKFKVKAKKLVGPTTVTSQVIQ